MKFIGKIIYRYIDLRNAKQRRTPQRRLSYFVLNILDHCNLRCMGCDHFAPLADKRFISPDSIRRDLARLSTILNGNVKRIGVMGGEPLLHPQLNEILIDTRSFFPKTIIHLVTNGILLLNQAESFWQVCREHDIMIVNTKYPIHLDFKAMEKTSASKGVKFRHYGDTGEKTKTSYKMALDINGGQDPEKSFSECFHANTYPFLMEGKFYACTVAPNVRHFNKRFGTAMELDEGDYLDIDHLQSTSDLLHFISSPKPFCRFCDVRHRSHHHPWQRSAQSMNEWGITSGVDG